MVAGSFHGISKHLFGVTRVRGARRLRPGWLQRRLLLSFDHAQDGGPAEPRLRRPVRLRLRLRSGQAWAASHLSKARSAKWLFSVSVDLERNCRTTFISLAGSENPDSVLTPRRSISVQTALGNTPVKRRKARFSLLIGPGSVLAVQQIRLITFQRARTRTASGQNSGGIPA